MTEWEAFRKERDEALLSLDKGKIQRYMEKYGVPMPSIEKAFWGGVHKAILRLNSAPLERKLQSAAWLKEHGFSVQIYGGSGK